MSARRRVADYLDAPGHAGRLDGAARLGEAAGDGRIVRIGLFPDGSARFRASSCASLIAYAEAACEAIEAGFAPGRLDAAALRSRVAGVHPMHRDRAALVAAAVADAFTEEER